MSTFVVVIGPPFSTAFTKLDEYPPAAVDGGRPLKRLAAVDAAPTFPFAAPRFLFVVLCAGEACSDSSPSRKYKNLET